MNQKEQLQGHGYFRKKKWAKGLASGIALGVAVITFAGATGVSADETTTISTEVQTELVASQPESTNENNAYAENANTSEGTLAVDIDNSAVENAATEASNIGVDVTKEATKDYGTDSTTAELTETKAGIANDQNLQIETLEQATATQEANNTAYAQAQAAIDANNDYVNTAKDTYGSETAVSVTNDSSTATNGSSEANKVAKTSAEQTLAENKKAVADYVDAKAKYDATVAKADELNAAVEAAANELKNKGVSVTTSSQVVNSAAEVEALQAQNDAAIVQANSEKTAVDALLAQYAADLAAFNNGTNVSVSAGVKTQDVDNLAYGNSFMNGTINADGTFTFTHDMNDGLNDTYGTLGTGTLTGKLNYRVDSQGNGNITVYLDSVELYTYSYTAYRPNYAVNQNLNFHVYTLGGTEIYSTYHTGNNSFTDTINRSTTLTYEHGVSVGDTLANVGFLNIDDNWIYNTHGQAVISFTNTNKAPDPVDPPEVKANLVNAVNPEKPSLELTSLSDTINQTIKASYHDYKLNYSPMVEKDRANSDGLDMDGKTTVKGDVLTDTLDISNIYANLNVGDTVTIIDPLEAGEYYNVDDNIAAAVANGWEVSYDAATETFTYKTTYKGEKLVVPTVDWAPAYDAAYYDNTYKVLVNDNLYHVYSNTVKTPTPEAPQPTKEITDTYGNDIDGSTTFDKNVAFHLNTDYTPYTEVTASTDAISKGFAILDDVEDGMFTVNEDGIVIRLTDDNGETTTLSTDIADVTEAGGVSTNHTGDSNSEETTAVNKLNDLFTMYHVLAGETISDKLQAILDQSGLSPVGEFYLWVAKDPASFYTNYVKAGKNITIDLPAYLTADAGTIVPNDFYQIDFGNAYQSNLVTVQVPDVSPEKHALDQKDDNIILDDQTVQIGEYIRYLLDGVTVPVKHDTLWQYDGKDKLDIAHDRYTGNWKGIIKGTEYTAKEDLVLTYDVTLEDGTLVKAGDTIKSGSKYAFTFEFDQDTNSDFINKIVTVTWDEEKGEWAYRIDEAFLRSLGVEGTFDADFYIEVERIAAGDVENTFVNIVNGKEMTAKVTTHTPEPAQPTPPQPTPPAPNTPVKQASLPSTGEASSILTVLGGFLLSGLSLAGVRKRKEN
ncbi:SspB-related isopeptide-forming adhesin [Streptococcus caprae]|uniref:SspB-related isopeptide-forming adhesin n=1 Tax=Streptococcus caprae TaxID=1640501 RepID=A0ABV8CXW2_9STRE